MDYQKIAYRVCAAQRDALLLELDKVSQHPECTEAVWKAILAAMNTAREAAREKQKELLGLRMPVAAEADCSDSLSAHEWSRLKTWFLDYLCSDKTHKPANLVFTASAARDAATAFESAVFEAAVKRPMSQQKP